MSNKESYPFQNKNLVANLKIGKFMSFNPSWRNRFVNCFKTCDNDAKKLDSWDAYIFAFSLRAMFSGTRFFWSSSKINCQTGYQGVETLFIKSFEIFEFHRLFKLISESNELSNGDMNFAKFLMGYINDPIDEFFVNNEDAYGYYKSDTRGIHNRIYMEWHFLDTPAIDLFYTFYFYYERLCVACGYLQELISKYQIQGDEGE